MSNASRVKPPGFSPIPPSQPVVAHDTETTDSEVDLPGIFHFFGVFLNYFKGRVTRSGRSLRSRQQPVPSSTTSSDTTTTTDSDDSDSQPGEVLVAFQYSNSSFQKPLKPLYESHGLHPLRPLAKVQFHSVTVAW